MYKYYTSAVLKVTDTLGFLFLFEWLVVNLLPTFVQVTRRPLIWFTTASKSENSQDRLFMVDYIAYFEQE